MDIRPGGSADLTDVALVAEKLRLIPAEITAELHRRGIGVVVCRESVTDYRRDLAGVHPRNWPEGVTWDVVPGCYLPDEQNVAIATIGEGIDRRVPLRGEKHGSFDLVVHEVMHADDYVDRFRRSDNAAFIAAQQADVASGGFVDNPYEAAVREESYAESAARIFGGDAEVAGKWREIARFWQEAALPVAPGTIRREIEHDHGGSIGTVTVANDDSLALDLTAADESGRIGHAYLVLRPGDAGYDPVYERLRDSRRGFDTPEVPVMLDPF